MYIVFSILIFKANNNNFIVIINKSKTFGNSKIINS